MRKSQQTPCLSPFRESFSINNINSGLYAIKLSGQALNSTHLISSESVWKKVKIQLNKANNHLKCQIKVIPHHLIQIRSPMYRMFATTTRYASFNAEVQIEDDFETRWFCFLNENSDVFPETLEAFKYLDRNHMSDTSYDGKECGSRTSFMSENLNFDFDLHDKLVKQDSLLRARLYIFNAHSLIGFEDVTFMRSSKEWLKTIKILKQVSHSNFKAYLKSNLPSLDIICISNCGKNQRVSQKLILKAETDAIKIIWSVQLCDTMNICANSELMENTATNNFFFSSIVQETSGYMRVIAKTDNRLGDSTEAMFKINPSSGPLNGTCRFLPRKVFHCSENKKKLGLASKI